MINKLAKITVKCLWQKKWKANYQQIAHTLITNISFHKSWAYHMYCNGNNNTILLSNINEMPNKCGLYRRVKDTRPQCSFYFLLSVLQHTK